jgi:ArsR family metal-binding transcriptional regulator
MLRDDCPGVGWIPPCATLAHSPEAQQRVKQIDKKICQLGDMIHEIQYAGKVSAEVINDLDSVLEVYSEVREAIALLQAGDHHE